MPQKPKKGESEKDFVSRCIPIVLDEGTAEDNKQAAAVCYSMWREDKKEKGKAIDADAILDIGGAEVALDDLVAAYKAMGPDEESRVVRSAWYEQYGHDNGPKAEDDKWVKEVIDGNRVLIESGGECYVYSYSIDAEGEVSFGDPQKVRVEYVPVSDDKAVGERFTNALKAISIDGDTMRVGNYMALWNCRDMEGYASARINKDGSIGEYFAPETTFESDYTKTGRLYVDFDHGTGATGDGDDLPAPGRDDVLGYVDWKSAKRDKRGLWVERVLYLRNKYMEFVKPLIEAELIGSSSEAVESKVQKGADGRLINWPLRRDSLTVIPMEWRMMTENPVIAKAFVGLMKSISLELPELPEPTQEPQDDGKGDGGPSRLDVERARAKAEATLSYIRTLEEVT